MTGLRRLAWVALALAYVHTVFGAIVRISGSGMGCGEHWPDCNGSVVPTVTSYRVVVEVTHRYLAATLLTATVVLAALAIAAMRRPAAARERETVVGPSILALGLVVTAALVGMAVVMLSLSNPYLIAVHYSIAMLTLAIFVVVVQRTGGLGADRVHPGDGSARTYRAARAAAVLAFVTVVLGALTANVPGAAYACRGFPWCRTGVLLAGVPLAIQITHRVLAIVLVVHLVATTIMVTRRRESPMVVRAAQAALGVIALQLAVAASLVELALPPVLQSLHQAVGTLLWVSVFTYAALARRAAAPRPLAATDAGPLIARDIAVRGGREIAGAALEGR
jgi:heme A synthase